MREIKFRAWDKFNNEMLEQEGANSSNSVVSFLDFYYNNSEDRPWGSEFNDLILMQYTGLKDKNGKEIYEGDIVEIAGLGKYVCEYPFFDLFDLDDYSDIGGVVGNIHENPELLEGSYER